MRALYKNLIIDKQLNLQKFISETPTYIISSMKGHIS